MPQWALMSPALIAIDWGSSSFRAYLLAPGGAVLEEIASGDGIEARDGLVEQEKVRSLGDGEREGELREGTLVKVRMLKSLSTASTMPVAADR